MASRSALEVTQNCRTSAINEMNQVSSNTRLVGTEPTDGSYAAIYGTTTHKGVITAHQKSMHISTSKLTNRLALSECLRMISETSNRVDVGLPCPSRPI